jgi:hypothetical protein
VTGVASDGGLRMLGRKWRFVYGDELTADFGVLPLGTRVSSVVVAPRGTAGRASARWVVVCRPFSDQAFPWP